MLDSVGGVVEQSMTRSAGGSSDMALHRDVVASCWESPCKLAALMNLRGKAERNQGWTATNHYLHS